MHIETVEGTYVSADFAGRVSVVKVVSVSEAECEGQS